MKLKDFLKEMDEVENNMGDMGRDLDDMPEDRDEDRTSPTGAYSSHVQRVRDLIEQIEDLVGVHQGKQSEDSDKWSHASDLVAVAEKLQEVVDMLGGSEEEPSEGLPDEEECM